MEAAQQSSQKSWTRLLKLLAKTLKNTCEWIFLEPATLIKMNFFLDIYQGFCLKDSEDFFHRTPPYEA